MNKFSIIVNERELATILGALKYWKCWQQQPEIYPPPPAETITLFANCEPVRPTHIDELCERITKTKARLVISC